MTQTANMVGVLRTIEIGVLSSIIQRSTNTFRSQLKTDLVNVFFSSLEFSETCEYTHTKSGETENYNVLFDDPSQDVDPGSRTEITLIQPQIQIAVHEMSQIPSVRDLIKVRGIEYKIESVENDGVGVYTLYLVRRKGAIH